ncbi:MAG: hypothetical protein ABI809_09535 [Caldimonas sp.]
MRIPPRSAHIGINLAGLAYWTKQFPFADLMKNSGDWAARDARGADFGSLRLTPDGYPAVLERGQRADRAVAWNDARYAPGQYVVLWEGDGEIGFPNVAAKVASRSPHRIVLDVADTRGALWVSIEKTNVADPVRNVRFLWPGSEATHPAQPFNPEFLAKIAPFRSLRFMDWAATNGSPVVRWSERALPTDVSYASRGVPLEAMIDLANELQAEPWFCIPHRADDDFVRRFALLLRSRLDPRRVATIEYSNEVWNGSFEQARWAVAESARLGLPLAGGQAAAFYAERTRRIAAIVSEAFGAAERKRWRAVIAGQAAWTNFATAALGWKDTATKVDVLAIAPYFQAAGAAEPAQIDATLALAPEQLIGQMRANIRDVVRPRIVENARLAQRHGLALDGYEGGAHDSSSYFPAARHDPLTALFAAAHRSPRMREVYREYLETWIAAGGGTLNQYNDIGKWSKWGLWGALEYVTEDPSTAPKYQALLDTIAAHPLAAR